MQNIIRKTFGGLTTQYYLRQFFFGGFLAALFIYSQLNANKPIEFGFLAFLVVNTLLYPYSRFVYESIVSFIMGENVFFINAIFMLIAKLFTMALCWSLAILIAPIGLAYLYYYHSKAAK
jgi:hypothetical protein